MSADRDRRDDAELVRLAADGSAAAFGALYDRHAPGVARALASFAGPDRDLLDDLLQDVFLRAARGLPRYAPTHPFAHWLYTIALNVGRNHARRRATLVPADGAVLETLAAPPTPDAVDAATLMALVARLPGHLREVVALRAGPDLAYGEIAELLGIPEGTARRRMHQALARLRALGREPVLDQETAHE